MFDRDLLAGNIRHYRKCSGMTQSELAEKLMISVQSVSKWECATAMPDLEKLCILAQLWHISLDTLMGISGAEPCFIGVDGGCSKTEFVLFAQDGTVLKRLVKPGCNPNACGMEETVNILKNGMDELIRETACICSADIGAAGLASGNYGEKVHRSLQRQYPQMKINCHGDILNVIASATAEEDVIAAICGTGSVVYTGNVHALRRIGGWGYLLDDVGSGYALGRDALRVALEQRDGIGEKSRITDLAERQLGDSVWNSIDAVYRGGNAFVASFAPLVSQAAEQGDAIAKTILCRHADGLVQRICYASTLCRGDTLVMSGSLIIKDRSFRQLVQERLPSALHPVFPSLPPVFGSCLSAFRLSGGDTAAIRSRLRETYLAVKERSVSDTKGDVK